MIENLWCLKNKHQWQESAFPGGTTIRICIRCLKRMVRTACCECEGAGSIPKPCADCGGSGFAEAASQDYCQSCGGSGEDQLTCPDCAGEGKIWTDL